MPSNNDLMMVCDRLSQAAGEFKQHAITLANLQREDRLDRAAVIRQRLETEFIESHFEKSPRIETEYNPLSKEQMDK